METNQISRTIHISMSCSLQLKAGLGWFGVPREGSGRFAGFWGGPFGSGPKKFHVEVEAHPQSCRVSAGNEERTPIKHPPMVSV